MMTLAIVPRTRKASERWQSVLRRGLEHMARLRLSDERSDEYGWSDLRSAMLAAGATERDIDRPA